MFWVGFLSASPFRNQHLTKHSGEISEAPANAPLAADGAHDFTAPAPNRLWLTDVTEFRLPCGRKVYLSPTWTASTDASPRGRSALDRRPSSPTRASPASARRWGPASARSSTATAGPATAGPAGSRFAGGTASPARCRGRQVRRTTRGWRGSSARSSRSSSTTGTGRA